MRLFTIVIGVLFLAACGDNIKLPVPVDAAQTTPIADGAPADGPADATPVDSAPVDAAPVDAPLPDAPNPVCGDGVIDPVEECDDGNVIPNDGCDPDCTRTVDTDGDRITDWNERSIGLDPDDQDTDDDGIPDGLEPRFYQDHDGDGLINALDFDSDNDGISDGVENVVDGPGPGTDTSVFIPDADPDTLTSMLHADTDGGGVDDGVEDANRNGRWDVGETNPLDFTDDAP